MKVIFFSTYVTFNYLYNFKNFGGDVIIPNKLLGIFNKTINMKGLRGQ